MMKKFDLTLLIIISMSFMATAQKMKPVFNGKNLNNWDIYIGTALKGFEELKEKATPDHIYSLVEKDNETLLHISGDINASIATKKEYENYHFRMEFKWGDEVYTTRNSGLLYHSFGPFGAGIDTWMSSIELQLMHENLGDAYMMADSYAEIPVKKVGDNHVFSVEGQMMSFGNDQKGGKIARKNQDMEKPLGEWNIVDLYCFGQKSIHVVNGVKVMECMNTGKLVNGEVQPLSKGKIQIQSEGGELYIRTAEIRKIKSLPENL